MLHDPLPAGKPCSSPAQQTRSKRARSYSPDDCGPAVATHQGRDPRNSSGGVRTCVRRSSGERCCSEIGRATEEHVTSSFSVRTSRSLRTVGAPVLAIEKKSNRSVPLGIPHFLDPASHSTHGERRSQEYNPPRDCGCENCIRAG